MVQQSIIETETAATEVRDALDQLNAHLLKGSYKVCVKFLIYFMF